MVDTQSKVNQSNAQYDNITHQIQGFTCLRVISHIDLGKNTKKTFRKGEASLKELER